MATEKKQQISSDFPQRPYERGLRKSIMMQRQRFLRYDVNFPIGGRKRTALWIAGSGALLSIVMLVQFFVDSIPGIRDYIVEMNTLPAFIYGVGMFTLISSVISGERTSKNGVVSELSRSSFGIYVIHVVYLDLLTNLLLPYSAFGEHAPALYLFILFGLTFGFSFGTVYLLTRINGMRKVFYYG